MGSLFKTSTPSVTPTLTQPTSLQNSVEAGVNEENASQDEDSVRDVIRRQTRGRSSTIQTSYRGVLEENEGVSSLTSLSPKRKTLLGE